MALRREDLRALGIEAEKIDTIINYHVDSLKAVQDENASLKADIENYKSQLADVDSIKSELATAKDTISKYEADDFKSKYEKEHADFESYKSDITAKETAATKGKALSKELKKAGYSDQAIRIIVNRSDYAKNVIFDEAGKPTNLEAVLSDIKSDSDFSGFTPSEEIINHKPTQPPANGGKANQLTKDEIMAVKNTADRQRLIAENPELFGI